MNKNLVLSAAIGYNFDQIKNLKGQVIKSN